jgi:hypothetical protein
VFLTLVLIRKRHVFDSLTGWIKQFSNRFWAFLGNKNGGMLSGGLAEAAKMAVACPMG